MLIIGLVALRSEDVLELMATDFSEKYKVADVRAPRRGSLFFGLPISGPGPNLYTACIL